MGDMKESEMKLANSVDYLRGLKGEDSIVVSRNEFLRGTFINRGALNKYNDMSLKSGIYYDFNTATDRHPKLIAYGMLLVFDVGPSMIVHIHIGTNQAWNTRIYANSTWYGWKSITLTV